MINKGARELTNKNDIRMPVERPKINRYTGNDFSVAVYSHSLYRTPYIITVRTFFLYLHIIVIRGKGKDKTEVKGYTCL